MNGKTYEEGLKEGILQGEINALKDLTNEHTKDITDIRTSMKTLERVSYSIVAVVGFVGIFPSLKAMFT